jgi:hypothetical protein
MVDAKAVKISTSKIWIVHTKNIYYSVKFGVLTETIQTVNFHDRGRRRGGSSV